MLIGMDANTTRFEPPPPEPVTVSFSGRSGTVSGTVSIANSQPREFHGWLELMDELERLRATGSRVPR
jgi:hypothetical protein